ncbi:MAG: DUF1836 domain-containing protein [Oscillospiraceae bacterium]|nr:DUF1836 domain-containing protein [Oscillospiraceae bacterium]
MTETDYPAVCAQVAGQKLPRWDELPDLELYMDQVLSLMERYLGAYPGYDRRGLTASMVNNYVKLGVMPPPVKKKYARIHLAHLIIICVLKGSFPIELIKNLILASADAQDGSAAYNQFCDAFEASLARAAEDTARDTGAEALWRTALRAQAEQALVLRLYDAVFPAAEKGKK